MKCRLRVRVVVLSLLICSIGLWLTGAETRATVAKPSSPGAVGSIWKLLDDTSGADAKASWAALFDYRKPAWSFIPTLAATPLAAIAVATTADTCVDAQALTVNTPVNDTTLGATNDYQLASGSACFTANGAIGNTPDVFVGPDVVYTFTAPATGTYSIRVQPTNTSQAYDVALYTSSVCPSGTGVQTVSCATAADRRGDNGGDEIKCQPLTAGQLIYIFVDGFRTTGASGAAGSYEIEVVNCVNETESNDTPATANALACGQEGSLIPITDVDFYSLGTPATGSRVFAILDGGPSLADDYDLRVTTDTTTLEYDDLQNVFPFGANSPNVAGTPTTGVATYLRVNYFSQTTPAAGVEPYRIVSVIQPPIASATTETEPNDTTATASFGVNNYFSGALTGTTDSVDFYGFLATAGDLVYLGLDDDPLRNNTPINGQIALLDSVGTVLVSVNDGGSTSSVTAGATLTATTPFSPGEGLLYRIRTTGTYYARVMGSTTAVSGDYLLSISKNCQSGGDVSSCPSTLTVNDLGDASDANPGDGICATGGGVCTLRAAVEEANAIPGCTPLTINFSVTGTINLGSVLPDLNHPNLTISGPGAANLTVARNSATLFRIFSISASRTVTITGLKITNGLAPGTNNGGGVHNSGTLNLSQCVISGNGIETTSVGGSAFGGGIYSAGPLTIDRCEVSGNSGRSGAGITHNGLGSGYPLIITNSTISGNTGVQSGGFDIRNTSASLTNCTISGNTAPGRIGGIDQVAQSGNTSSLLLTNCTVTNNTGSAAIETFGFAGVTSLTTTLKNTLVAGNVGANFTTTLGTVTSLGNNLDSDGTSGFTNGANGDIVGTSGSPINALLGPLAQNGGPTQTHALLPGSPAINAGTNTGAPATDQRGIARPQQTTTDIGAFESRGFTLAIVSGNNQTTPPTTVFAQPLLVSVTSGFGEPVQGGRVTFVPPGSGPSATLAGNPATINASGLASVTATANNQQGSYQVAAAAKGANTVNFSLANQCQTLSLSVPGGTAGTSYSQTISGAPLGGNYTFTQTGGTLPPGLTLQSSGLISGTPTTAGSFTFQVQATGYGGGCVSSQSVTLAISCPAITLNPASLPGGMVGTSYSQTVSATPATLIYTFAVTGGTLPPGLTLNASTGAITGTPTTTGSFNFTITASSSGCTGSLSFTVVIGCASITLPASLPAATLGVAYSASAAASPSGTYTYSLQSGALASGLTLNTSTGAITGTPSGAGTYSFTIKATGASNCMGTQSYSLTVSCPTITISPAILPNGTTGTAYSQTISASPAGGNYTFAVSSGSLPAGLNLNPSTGVLSGTPTANGTFNFSVTATGFGSCASAPKSYSITIGTGGCPTITLPNVANTGSIGSPYSQSVAASPSGSYTYTLTGTVPSGVTFYNAAALLYGYPTTNGTFNFTITATDSNNCTGSKSYSVTIGGAFARAVVNDFDGDGKSDLAVWRGKQSQWEIAGSIDGKQQVVQMREAFDPASDVMACADYDGDGKYDLAFYHRATGQWMIRSSKDGAVLTEQWGIAGDVPVSADYDGDGKDDLAVWRESENTWYIKRSSDGQMQTEQFGASGMLFRDVPVPADYDGDGKTDIAIFRQGIRQAGHWYIKQSSDGLVIDKEWGLNRDVPVVADYDGDGKADIAVWRGSEGGWYILNSSGPTSDNAAWTGSWGALLLGDVPVPGDYDGDGKADIAVWRASESSWYVRGSFDETVLTKAYGQAGDTPVTGRR